MADNRGKKPKPGDTVVLTEVPHGLLDHLPQADKQAISEAVGKLIALNGYDDDGRAELQFTDDSGVIHFIYVKPDVIRAAK
jgi:hypothetical protein